MTECLRPRQTQNSSADWDDSEDEQHETQQKQRRIGKNDGISVAGGHNVHEVLCGTEKEKSAVPSPFVKKNAR